MINKLLILPLLFLEPGLFSQNSEPTKPAIYCARLGSEELGGLRLCQIDFCHRPSQIGNGVPSVDPELPSLQFGFISQSPNLQGLTACSIDGIVEEIIHQKLDLCELTLKNGMKVCLKPTTFEKDEIVIRLDAVGGIAALNDNQRGSAELAAQTALESGLGDLSVDQLSVLLYEYSIEFSTEIHPFSRTISGSSNVDGVEKFFSLVNLTFTQSKFKSEAFKQVLTRTKEEFKKRAQVSDNHHLFGLRPLNLVDFDKVDFETAKGFFQRCFADPSEFVCVVVGNFNLDKMKGWVNRYLASIPKSNTALSWKNQIFPNFPSTVITKVTHLPNQKDSKAKLTFSLNVKLDEQKLERVKLVCQVIEAHLRRVFCQEDQKMQGLNVAYELPLYPFLEQPWITIQYNASTKIVNEIAQEVLKELQLLQMEGPLVQDVEMAKSLKKKGDAYWLKDNYYWVGTLSNVYLNRWNPNQILSEEDMKIGIEEIKHIVSTYFNLNNSSIVTK